MFKYASNQKTKTAILISVCLLAILSVTISRYYKKTQMTIAPKTFSGATNEERLAFLKDNGIKADSEPFYVCDIIIPSSFDGIYESFEKTQNEQGLSLSQYKGKKVRRFSYNVKNPPKEIEKASAEILVSDGKIIACALCSLTNNGGFFKIIG